MLSIGERLKNERLRLGKNQTELAIIGGVGKTTQINYEKDERSPDATYLAAIAKIGADVLYVITGEYAMTYADGLSDQEAKLVSGFRQISPGDQVTVMNVTKAMMMARGLFTESK